MDNFSINDYLISIQKSAMASVAQPDFNAFMRKISRWFSKTYSTPLLEVDQLDPSYVLQHYFEHTFEEMDKDERINKIIQLLETSEERRERELKEEEEEDAFVRKIEEELAQEQEKDNKEKLKSMSNF